MRLPTTRHTPLTGEVKTVAVPNVMQTASFHMMDWCVMQSGGGHHDLGGEGGAAGDAAMLDCPLIPHPPTTDDMLTAQNPSDKDMTRTMTKKQRTKTKKSGSLNHGGHSTQHLKNVHKAGRGSLKK